MRRRGFLAALLAVPAAVAGWRPWAPRLQFHPDAFEMVMAPLVPVTVTHQEGIDYELLFDLTPRYVVWRPDFAVRVETDRLPPQHFNPARLPA